MSMTSVIDVSQQVGKVWGPVSKDELIETSVLMSLVNRQYDGFINNKNDTVYLSQISQLTAQQVATSNPLHVDFASQTVGTTRVAVTADQVFSVAIELSNLIELQTQLGGTESLMRAAMVDAMNKAINDYLYGIVSPSLAAPDHSIAGVTDFNESEFARIRLLAAQAKWPDGQRYLILDPSYYNDALAVANLTNVDYGAADAAKIGGKFSFNRYGFTVIEDNSAGLLTAGAATGTADVGLAFQPNFMNFVMSTPKWEVSSMHSNKKDGYLLSMIVYAGAALGLDGAKKHILTYNT